MSDNARLEGVVGSGAAQKRGAGTVAGAARGTPPPRKAASAAPGSSAPVSSGGGPSSSGRHAAARAGAREVLARQQAGRKAQPVNELFELPPVFEAAVARQVAVRSICSCARRLLAAGRWTVPAACRLEIKRACVDCAYTELTRERRVACLPCSSSSACSAQRRCSSRCRQRSGLRCLASSRSSRASSRSSSTRTSRRRSGRRFLAWRGVSSLARPVA